MDTQDKKPEGNDNTSSDSDVLDEQFDNEPADTPPKAPEIKDTKPVGDLAVCEKERKEFLEGWQRTKADFINYKNDEAKRMEDMARFVVSSFLQDVIPVLDSFDLALGHGGNPEMERGILLIRSQFEDILKRRGVEMMNVKAGDRFDAEKHESIGEIESDGIPGSVGEVVQRGYLLKGKVIRPARVRMSVLKKAN